MLILEVRAGQSVSLIDAEDSKDIGVVKFMGIRVTKKDCIVLGFDCPKNIRVLRETLMHDDKV